MAENLQGFVALMDEVVDAGLDARRTGRDQPLPCGSGCKVDAALDAAAFVPDCATHGPLLTAYREQRT